MLLHLPSNTLTLILTIEYPSKDPLYKQSSIAYFMYIFDSIGNESRDL